MSPLPRFLRFFFHHLYTTFAWTYDLVAWLVSVGQWRNWTLSMLDLLPTGPTLELGHGPGHLLLARMQEGHPIVGLDRSAQMNRIARRRLLRAGLRPLLVRAEAQALPFRTGQFQAVLSTFPSEYAFDPQTLLESLRALRGGASLCVLILAEITGSNLPDRMAAWLFRVTGQYREFQEQWLQPLRQAGFQVQRRDLTLRRARLVRIEATKPYSPAESAS